MQRHYFGNKGLSSQGYGISSSHVWTWKLDYKESWAPKNRCFWTVVLEKILESHLDSKEIQPVHLKELVLNIHWKDWCWNWNSNTLAIWYEELIHWKRPWCGERLKEGGKGDDRGWDGWMASSIRWTRVWVNSWSWWLTGRPGVLPSMGSKESDTTEQLNLTDWTQFSSTHCKWLKYLHHPPKYLIVFIWRV